MFHYISANCFDSWVTAACYHQVTDLYICVAVRSVCLLLFYFFNPSASEGNMLNKKNKTNYLYYWFKCTFPFCCLRHTFQIHPFLQSETTKVDLSAVEVDPSSSSDRDRGVRRPRRYITPGDSRMSERFRTQPITSAERLESDRYKRRFLY